jgi:dinuclear metal center YbgI/SA1388 family protein
MAYLEHILQFLEETFEVSGFPDYPNALNGLQVEGLREIHRIATAVDASEEAIRRSVEAKAQLLVVHHGLFWEGFGPLVGPRFRKVGTLIRGKAALYSLHLPLDAHSEFGNCALLARAMGLQPGKPFGDFEDRKIGWSAKAEMDRETLKARISRAVEGPVRLVPGGPEEVGEVGVVTGGGASTLREAAAMGFGALITGEAAHHHYHEAHELGVNLYLAGHYATETFGVKALGATLAEVFSLEWDFLDLPTGF